MAAVPGVLSAHINRVCCDGGKAILYVGIEEQGNRALQFRSAPHGRIRLSDDIVQAGHALDEAGRQAILRGDSGEDHSEGHALMHDPAARAIQQRFIAHAARDLSRLRDVLRHSSDTEHRALAAQVLGTRPTNGPWSAISFMGWTIPQERFATTPCEPCISSPGSPHGRPV